MSTLYPGTYTKYPEEVSLAMEAAYRTDRSSPFEMHLRIPIQGMASGKAKERTATFDFKEMKVSHDGGWSGRIRRWDVQTPMADSWDHQDDEVKIVDIGLDDDECDRVTVESSVYKERADRRKPLISRDTHQMIRICRIQNRGLLRDWEAQRQKIENLRGKDALNICYAWHGTGKNKPLDLATGKNGFMTQFGAQGGFYNKGFYFAEHASYSHEYAYRSSDEDGKDGDAAGSYFHLILCKVILGKTLVSAEPFAEADRRVENFAAVQARLDQGGYDSVTGGPHQPKYSGPGPNDSVMYVDYTGKQCLPEFIVTYKAGPEQGSASSGRKRKA